MQMDGKKLTAEEARYWYGEQDENGVDLEHLRYNLSLTPEQRIERNRRAVESLRAIREAVRVSRYRRAS